MRVDFENLADWLVRQAGGTELVHATYYTGVEPRLVDGADNPFLKFLDYLDSLPRFFVRRLPRVERTVAYLNCPGPHRYTTEKMVDTSICADMVEQAASDTYDMAVLVGGDADHAPGVKAVRSLGKEVFVSTWARDGLSRALWWEACPHVNLDRSLR